MVELASEPAGATVRTASGRELGQTPLPLTSDALGSDRSLIVELAGYRNATATVELPGPGEKGQTAVALRALPVVTIRSNPSGAEVRLEDERAALGTTPLQWTVPAGVEDELRKGVEIALLYDKAGFRQGRAVLNSTVLDRDPPVLATVLHPARTPRGKGKGKREGWTF